MWSCRRSPDSTTQFVTAVKLQELRAQHSQLREAYDRLTAQVEATTDPYQRLRRLYRGLADLTYAGRKVHSELVDLGVSANDTLPGRAISADLAERWSSRLVNERTDPRGGGPSLKRHQTNHASNHLCRRSGVE